MSTSPYCERALFYHNSRATDDYFKSRINRLFVQCTERSHVECYFQLPVQKSDADNEGASEAAKKTSTWASDSESSSKIDPSWPIADGQRWGERPRCSEGIVLCKSISDVQTLQDIAIVSVLLA